MPFIEWSEKLSVMVPLFDEQHKKLIAIINELHDAMDTGCGREVLGELFDKLIDYTVYHFETERKALDFHEFPKLAEHMAAHKGFTDKVLDLKRRFEAKEILISIDLSEFLQSWLVDHIMGADKAYGIFFKENRITVSEKDLV